MNAIAPLSYDALKTGGLNAYESMRLAVQTCVRMDETKDWLDQASALAHLARQRDDHEIEVWMQEIKLRASVRIGEIVRALDVARTGRPKNGSVAQTSFKESVIEASGLARGTAYEYQRLAGPRDENLAAAGMAASERYFAAARHNLEPATKAGLQRAVTAAVDAAMGVVPPPGAGEGVRRAKAAHIYDRDPHEWYVEPVWTTTSLLRHEIFTGPVWDPACGGGNILAACRGAGLPCFGTDIVRRVPATLRDAFAGEHDFLDDAARHPRGLTVVDIIVNPPFFRARGTESFIRKALTIATGKVAVFADVNFLAGQRRGAGLFAEHCPHRVWIHSVRPSCPPGSYLEAGNAAEGGSEDWCWMVWDLTAPPVTSFEGCWIRPEAGPGPTPRPHHTAADREIADA